MRRNQDINKAINDAQSYADSTGKSVVLWKVTSDIHDADKYMYKSAVEGDDPLKYWRGMVWRFYVDLFYPTLHMKGD